MYLAETRTQRAPIRARRAPSLVGGARSSFERRRHERKECLLVPEGSLCWREVRRLCLEESRHGRKARFFVPEGRLCRRKGRSICLE